MRVLHLDDDPFELDRFQGGLMGDGWHLKSCLTIETYRRELKAFRPDLVVLDVQLGEAPEGGKSLIEETRLQLPDAVLLMCSGLEDAATISDCLSLGADDYLSKQTDHAGLPDRLRQSYRLARERRGAGTTFERAARRVPRILASAVAAVYLEGESGTGKEMVADCFAANIAPDAPFVKVNCGAIAPSLLESELFGHVRGAFTGALADKKGLIESASGGWIFLDEVASLSLSAQAALLRALENQELRRVGATATIRVQVRVLSASNERLEALVAAGKFRRDLWQRLRETEIVLPPLRERPAEIPVLIRHFCATMPGGPYRISDPAVEILANHAWKDGNVRELRNCLRAMTELHVDKLLTPLSIPERIWMDEESTEAEIAKPGEYLLTLRAQTPVLFDVLSDRLLLELIRALTAKTGRTSLRKLAKAIGMSRSTLSGRLKMMVQRELVELRELTLLVGVGDGGIDGA